MTNVGGNIKILQFNVEKSRSKVLVPLLASKEARQWDVILVQEPWRNPHGGGTYCPRAAGFTQVIWPDTSATPARACILVNDKYGPDQWQLVHRERDLVAISLQVIVDGQMRQILVTSIYNPIPASPRDPQPSHSTLPELTHLLQRTRNTTLRFVGGDFNLHHPMWEP